jgi:hypothetical protein
MSPTGPNTIDGRHDYFRAGFRPRNTSDEICTQNAWFHDLQMRMHCMPSFCQSLHFIVFIDIAQTCGVQRIICTCFYLLLRGIVTGGDVINLEKQKPRLSPTPMPVPSLSEEWVVAHAGILNISYFASCYFFTLGSEDSFTTCNDEVCIRAITLLHVASEASKLTLLTRRPLFLEEQ